MSEQILVQGKLLGIDEFLVSDSNSSTSSGSNEILGARSLWITLVCEVIPRALLAELELARLLLGSSGGGQFLIVLPDTVRPRAEEFLAAAAQRISAMTGHKVSLIWGITENLGDWTVVRKRLNDVMQQKRDTPLAGDRSFVPYSPAQMEMNSFFTPSREQELRVADSVGWSPELETVIAASPQKHNWALTANLSVDGISIARHAAPGEEGRGSANLPEMGSRSHGRRLWGVLRGDVDDFGVRLRRVQTIEEHVQLSMLYKQFFAGELEVLCSLPEFWRRVTILYSGGNDFSVYGSWDALILLARELQRMFHRFAEENLKDFPGAEAKTITMACTLAADADVSLAKVYAQCGRDLAVAKASDKDCIFLLGRILEWKQLADAAELKEAVERISEEFRSGKQFLSELANLYQKVSSPLSGQADHEKLLRRAYRFQRKFSTAARSGREREFQKMRTHLTNEIVGRNVKPARGKQLKLRPAGIVALEWARLAQEV